MTINTVIFDLDGTLLDTIDDLCSSFNYALDKFGYKKRTRDEFKIFVGNGVKKALERASDFNVSDNILIEMTECFKIHYLKHNEELTKPYDGINELLETLKESGYKTAVVSNKFDDAVKELCNKYFKRTIDEAVGEGYGVRRKPEKDGILKVCELLSADISTCIYIGDSDTDILTAKNAGIPCISACWGYRTKEFLIASGAEMLAEKPGDIIKLIT